MTTRELLIEAVGWTSTVTFLVSIVLPQRLRIHELGMFTSVTTGLCASAHGATAIWVKWAIALVFHLYRPPSLRFAHLSSRGRAARGWRGSSLGWSRLEPRAHPALEERVKVRQLPKGRARA